MRIDRIEVENCLSFQHILLPDLDRSLNVIVGPNGAGKSNLIRVIRMVRDALDVQARGTWEQAAHKANREVEFRVRMDFELTEEWEKRLLAVFFQAMLATLEVPQTLLESHLEWIETLSPETIEDLYKGTLEITCSAGRWWTVIYHFAHDGVQFRWLLDGVSTLGLVRRDVEPGTEDLESDTGLQTSPPLGRLLHTEMRPEDELRVLGTLYRRPFELSAILPERGQMIQRLEVSTSWVRGGPPPRPIRKFVELAGVATMGEPRVYSGLFVLACLFRRGLLFTDDLRAGPRELWTAEELIYPADGIDVSSGENLPLYLFRLKNGPSRDPDRYHATQEIFRQLTKEVFDVALEAGGEGIERDSTAAPPDRFRLSITVGRTRMPVRLSGAGVWEALLLSALLAPPADRVLCLDEPALNLHPTLQRQVLRKIQTRGGQNFLVTHSPYLVPSANELDLTRILRFSLDGESTRITRLTMPATPEDRERWGRVLKELRRGIDTPALLFARGVILVEGETEAAALQIWFQKSEAASRGNLEDLNLVVHGVGGRDNVGKYVEFLKAFGVAWAAVCDGDTFKEERFCRAFDLPLPEENASFGQVKETWEALGIFTLSEDFGTFENLPYVEPHLEAARREAGPRSKPLQGRYIAENSDCPVPVSDLYGKIQRQLGVV